MRKSFLSIGLLSFICLPYMGCFNAAPEAKDDTAETAKNVAVSIDVLKNDSDPDGDKLTVDSFTEASNGTVTLGGGKVLYTPSADFLGSDSFEYEASDGNGGIAKAKVKVTVITGNCLADDTRCNPDDNVDTCGADNRWTETEQCAYGCEVVSGTAQCAQQICVDNALRCSHAGNLEICSNNSWNQQEECSRGCEVADGTAQCIGPPCENGLLRCANSGDLEICNQESWNLHQQCDFGCNEDGATPECNPYLCEPGEDHCLSYGILEVCNATRDGWDQTSCPAGCEVVAGHARCVDGCAVEDQYEEPVEGENPPTINTNTQYQGNVCAIDDADWFAIAFEQGDMVSGTLNWTGSTDMDIMLFADPDDLNPLASAMTSSKPEVLSYVVQQAGTYYVLVQLWDDAAEEYTISIDVQQPQCNNQTCEYPETCETCPADCPCPVCPDQECNGDETCDTCPDDCGACACPDQACNGDETCETCPQDCGFCNRDCDNPGLLESGESYPGDTSTRDPQLTPSCGDQNDTNVPDEIFQFTATCDGDVTLLLNSTSCDMVMALYEDSCQASSNATCVDNTNGTGVEMIANWPVSTDDTYMVLTSGYRGSNCSFTLDYTLECEPCGDTTCDTSGGEDCNTCPEDCGECPRDCAAPAALASGNGNTGDTTSRDNATLSCATEASPAEFWQYTAYCAGTATATVDSTFDAAVAAYHSSCQASSTDCVQATTGAGQETVSFAIAAQEDYFVAVSGNGAADTGTYSIDFAVECEPCGDTTCDAGGGETCQTCPLDCGECALTCNTPSTLVAGTTHSGSTRDAYNNLDSACEGETGVPDEVWTFTADRDGCATVSVDADYPDVTSVVLSAYSPTCENDSEFFCVASDLNVHQLDMPFAITSGSVYFVVVSGYYKPMGGSNVGDTGPYTLDLTLSDSACP